MQLFAENKLGWSKVASAELEEDSTQWPRQVLTELFRALPEISEYTPDVKFMHVNEEQGYALGVVVVSNSTNTALTTQQGEGNKAPKALIPLIIKNGRLCPLDIVMSAAGKMYPLTADRLREVLYRPEAFDLLSDDWNDSSIWQLFQPPGRGDFGTGQSMGGSGGQGVQYMMGPGMKSASVLHAIRNSMLDSHLQDFASRIEANPLLLKVALGNPAMREALRQLDNVAPLTMKTAAGLQRMAEDHHVAQVVQMRWDGDAYVVKTANRDRGVFRRFELDRGDFLKFAGEKIAARVDTEGSVAASVPGKAPVLVAGARGETPRVIETSGYRTVFEAGTGKPHSGWVFTKLIDSAGHRSPISVFVSDEGAVIQDQIAGVSADGLSNAEEIPVAPPKGQGIFVSSREGYDRVATMPVTVKGSTSTGESISYRCIDLTGEDVTITLQRGIKAIMAFPDRKEILMPWGASFVSTEHALPALIGQAPEEESNKVSSALLQPGIRVSSCGENFNLTFRHLPKLASRFASNDVSHDDALFTLCVAGLDAQAAYQALHKTAQQGALLVPIAEDLGSMPFVSVEKIAQSSKEIQALRTDLLKEAAELPDSMTVDAVLSLDFINSENVRTFISMIPYLEKSLNRICELVFASRLGLNEIPEAAGSRAARGLNDVIRGLKALALRQIEALP
jgi:hypothetical protein